jgi:hypothetical protein
VFGRNCRAEETHEDLPPSWHYFEETTYQGG